MAPKFLPPELLFEIVAFIPAIDSVPNAFTSCWLLHSLLLQRVTKWKQQMADDRQFKLLMEKIDEKFAKIDEKFAEMDEKFDEKFAKIDEKFAEMDEKFAEMKTEIDGKFTEIQDQIQDLKAEINRKAAKISIEVPAQGLTIEKATKAGLLDLESGQLTIMCDTATNLSLAKAIEIGMLDPQSMTVCDSSHGEKRELHLDKALNEGVLDENGKLMHGGRRLSLFEGIDKKVAKCTGGTDVDLGKKTIYFDSNQTEVSMFGKRFYENYLPMLYQPAARPVIISSPRIDLDNLDLRAKVITATSVLLMWNRGKPPRGNYGGYQIQKMVRDDGYWLDVYKVPYQQGKNTYEWLYDNLKPKTFYLFRLKIINNEGIPGQPKILEVRTLAPVKKRTSVAKGKASTSVAKGKASTSVAKGKTSVGPVEERAPWRK